MLFLYIGLALVVGLIAGILLTIWGVSEALKEGVARGLNL